MDKYTLTDKYGAVMLFKMIIAALKESTPNKTMENSNEIVFEYLEKNMADIQGEIFKDFIGTINGLSDMVKENVDDKLE